MPKIQEYQPQVAAPEPMGGLSPNLEVVNQLGSGVERFGRQITDTADAIESRSAQMEAADAQSQMADARVNFQGRINQETQNRNLNQQQILDDYDSQVSEQGAKFDTARGKAEFERASSRTRGQIQHWMMRGQAEISGANAIDDHNNTINNFTNSVQADPRSFDDTMGSLLEYQEGLKSDPYMGQNPEALEKQNIADRTKLATAAIQGHMNQDYNNIVQDTVASGGKIDPSDARYTTAEAMIQSSFGDMHLPAQEKEALLKSARSTVVQAQQEGSRVLNARKAAQNQQVTDFQTSLVPQMIMGGVPTKVIADGASRLGMTLEQAHALASANTSFADYAARGINRTPTPLYNDAHDKVLNGQITTATELQRYVPLGLAGDDYKKLHTLLDSTPQGQQNLEAEKSLMSIAKGKLVNQNLFLGKNDPEGQQQLALFSRALQQEKQNAANEGRPVGPLLDPTSKEYFGNKIDQFKLTPQQQQAAMTARFSLGASPLPAGHTVNTVTPAAQPAQTVKTPPPGLTFEQFKAWKKSNGQ